MSPNLPVSLTVTELSGIWRFPLLVNDIAHRCSESGGSDRSWLDLWILVCVAVKVLLTITCAHARGMDAFKLMKELRLNYEQEVHFLPKKTGLSLIASSVQVRPLSFFKHRGVSAYL